MKKRNKFAVFIAILCMILTVIWLIFHKYFISGFTGFLWITGWAGVVIFLVISSVIALAYMEKRAVWINIFCILLIVINQMIYNISKSDEDEIWNRMEKVVSEILSGKLKADETGTILLPQEKQYQDISDDNRVILVSDDEKRGIYFYTFSGLLESSRGYIYIVDELPEEGCNSNYDIVNLEHYKGNWYSCATD